MSGEYMHGILVAKCRKEIESGKTMAISVSPPYVASWLLEHQTTL